MEIGEIERIVGSYGKTTPFKIVLADVFGSVVGFDLGFFNKTIRDGDDLSTYERAILRSAELGGNKRNLPRVPSVHFYRHLKSDFEDVRRTFAGKPDRIGGANSKYYSPNEIMDLVPLRDVVESS